MSGGYEYEVVGEALQDLFCPICLNLLKNAMELECGHALCQTCLQNLEASSKERGFGFVCPSCKQEIHSERVNPAKTINRIVLGVKVKCEHFMKGCLWIGELSNMPHHLQRECNFQLVNCTFEQCKETIERHMLCGHLEECLYQPVTCEYCSVACLKLEMEDHYNTCEKYPVFCPNNCSLEKMERNMVGDHRKSCSNEVIACEFSSFGCQFESSRKYLLQHGQDASQYHLSLTLKSVNEMTVKMKDMEESIKIQILETNRTIEFMKTEEMTKTATTERRISEMSAEIQKISLKNLEAGRTIECIRKEEIRRVAKEEMWYTDKLLDLFKLEINSENVCEELKPSFDDVVKEFDENLGLINKGLPWLRDELKGIAAREDTANRERFSNQFRKKLKKCMLVLKKDVFVFEINEEKLFNQVLRKIFEEGQERHIESILKCDKRFHSLLNTMEINTKYSCGKEHFYKLNLFKRFPLSGAVLVDNEDVSISFCPPGFLYWKKINPAVKSFIIYNSKMEEKIYDIDATQERVDVSKLMNQITFGFYVGGASRLAFLAYY
ncbi:TNF receptor-associated factor 3-like [Hydractinia symbiolongicarpus]|uniref:TNF receptor-associated factor 3-like n=1 Tax=Hydractinia symbiolongicarpus TaxID=13093 RepID=UPI00254B96F3|nr:TNF receptor-associated factor 3-like [Hydractinia symbiolongicarpus]